MALTNNLNVCLSAYYDSGELRCEVIYLGLLSYGSRSYIVDLGFTSKFQSRKDSNRQRFSANTETKPFTHDLWYQYQRLPFPPA
jgi:hypothetical protein